VRRSERGRGLATEALRLLTQAARDQGLDRLWLEIHQDNPASFRVAEKCGFRDEGRRDDGMQVYALEAGRGDPPFGL